jgi:DNA-binding IclR family transcriptional regulator
MVPLIGKKKMPRTSHAAGKSVGQRLIAILGLFEKSMQPLTLNQISEQTGLPVATAHRLVNELVTGGLLTRGSDRRFRVGTRLWLIANHAPVSDQLRESALPTLARLYEETGENVTLAIMDRNQALYVDRIFGAKSVPTLSKVGGHLPLHTTGVGKVLLAYQPSNKIDELLSRKLEAPTKKSITDPMQLRQDLEQIKARGYSIAIEEMTLGSASIAVPVRVNNRVVAAVGLVVHIDQFNPKLLFPKLQSASRTIELALQAGK